MEKNRLSKVKKIENYFNILTKYPLLSLLLIGIGAITIRLIFFENELILSSDSLAYFMYSLDVTLTGELPRSINLPNNGWPLFMSIFFNFLESKNFLDYMNLQSYVSMTLSTVTIFPLYFLAKKFTNSSFALITTILFVFEPRIIQNSLIGATDPLFILLIVTSLTFILEKNKYIIYGACITIALASIVRAEGLFLIPALCIMFLIKNKITKKNIIQCIIFIIIIYLIILPFSMQRIESTGNDYLTSRIIIESQSLVENNSNEIYLKIINSFYIFIGFLGKLMIPYLLIFVPVGIILFLKEENIRKKILLIIPGFFMILPSLYAYTIPALDSRYLFPILPILCIFGTFAFMKYVKKIKNKKSISVILIIIIITSSSLFLVYKNTDLDKEKEFLELANIVNQKTDTILYINLNPVLSHLDQAGLLKLEKFPVLSSDYEKDSRIKIIEYSNIESFFINMEKKKITHVVIDEQMNNPKIIMQVFDNYNEYKNIKKIFDSVESGFNYNIKIFEIKYK